MRYGSWSVIVFALAVATPGVAEETPEQACQRNLQSIVQRASRSEKLSIQVAESQGQSVDGRSGTKVQLRWRAFSQDFLVDLFSPDRPLAPGEERQPRDFSGTWNGHAAELVLFSRWPSGAWEGQLKDERELYTIRIPCEERSKPTSGTDATIYYMYYPELLGD